MDDTHDDRPATPEPRQPFQFGLRSLFVLMVACTVLLKLMDKFVVTAPAGFRLVVALYFMALTAYAILCVPHIWRRKVGLGWRRVRQQRKELEDLAARLRGRKP